MPLNGNAAIWMKVGGTVFVVMTGMLTTAFFSWSKAVDTNGQVIINKLDRLTNTITELSVKVGVMEANQSRMEEWQMQHGSAYAHPGARDALTEIRGSIDRLSDSLARLTSTSEKVEATYTRGLSELEQRLREMENHEHEEIVERFR